MGRTMSTLKDHWLNGARELLLRAIELRRRIHRRPELDVEIAEGAVSSGLIVTVRGAPGPNRPAARGHGRIAHA